ncbi:SDR family NAD(P)-dependent oxidoreductase [Nesterenkonia haasae]|uniref:SDR family NAD(P)-dependent oxidoreductase n=1 Tax=Nesterenkonia haasae TaxID=2587813 RepID=UPI001391F3F3|nr:glucose 1-dehydrogenase [Nesterenkonia haasae]NDK31644.1 glucose 1-dehydrogenase [Nesterenkonia haasae]
MTDPNTPQRLLENKNIIITGAGSGIGAATARMAAAKGASVAVVDLDARNAGIVAAEINDSGGTAVAFTADVALEAEVEAMVEAVAEAFGRIHGIVNNAGVIVTRALVDTSVEEWDRCMDINARGVFLGCKYAVRHFLEHAIHGAIVNTGSISALTGQKGQVAYAASKGAIVQLTRQVAVEHAAAGIRCNSVGPGSVRSAVLDAFLSSQDDPLAAEVALAQTHPVNRIGSAEEVAGANCFLLSDEASFITGANLQVDGGYTAA